MEEDYIKNTNNEKLEKNNNNLEYFDDLEIEKSKNCDNKSNKDLSIEKNGKENDNNIEKSNSSNNENNIEEENKQNLSMKIEENLEEEKNEMIDENKRRRSKK